MNISDSYSSYIDKLICSGVPFAFYRKPGEGVEFMVQTDDTVCCLNDICDLDSVSGYVMAPFEVKEASPIVVIRPDCVELDALQRFLADLKLDDHGQRAASDFQEQEVGCCATEADYTDRIEPFLDALRRGDFDKLVLSRKQPVTYAASKSIGRAFVEACDTYVRSYVYVCYTPQTGLWLGSTPEIILAGDDEGWHTVALAGTQSLVDGSLPTEWSAKNRREQAYVAEYIRSILQKNAVEVDEEGPRVVQAGALAHLKTSFRFHLNGTCTPAELLAYLHPTPAVCGLPKEASFRFILAHEGYDRSYYSGFTGRWNCAGKTDLFVNLRCMKCREHQSVLYAGGGILPSSDIHDEWLETEKKMQTMYRLLKD